MQPHIERTKSCPIMVIFVAKLSPTPSEALHHIARATSSDKAEVTQILPVVI